MLSRPGSQYHVSNIGFEILGLIAARASGDSLVLLYHERIIAPLRLTETAYYLQGPIAGNDASAYSLGMMLDVTAVHAGVGAEGGLVSSAPETAQFLVGLMRGDLLGQLHLSLMKSGFWFGGEAAACGGVRILSTRGALEPGSKADVWVSRCGTARERARRRLNRPSGGRAHARPLHRTVGDEDQP